MIDEPEAFRLSRSAYVEAHELLEDAHRDTMTSVDAAVQELMRTNLRLWLVVHWQYARTWKPGREVPAVFRNGHLPPEDSDAFLALLSAAKFHVREALIRKRLRHLL